MLEMLLLCYRTWTVIWCYQFWYTTGGFCRRSL